MVLIFNSVSFKSVHLGVWFRRQDLSVSFECTVLGSTMVTDLWRSAVPKLALNSGRFSINGFSRLLLPCGLKWVPERPRLFR